MQYFNQSIPNQDFDFGFHLQSPLLTYDEECTSDNFLDDNIEYFPSIVPTDYCKNCKLRHSYYNIDCEEVIEWRDKMYKNLKDTIEKNCQEVAAAVLVIETEQDKVKLEKVYQKMLDNKKQFDSHFKSVSVDIIK